MLKVFRVRHQRAIAIVGMSGRPFRYLHALVDLLVAVACLLARSR
jgi:hypothetical protein